MLIEFENSDYSSDSLLDLRELPAWLNAEESSSNCPPAGILQGTNKPHLGEKASCALAFKVAGVCFLTIYKGFLNTSRYGAFFARNL